MEGYNQEPLSGGLWPGAPQWRVMARSLSVEGYDQEPLSGRLWNGALQWRAMIRSPSVEGYSLKPTVENLLFVGSIVNCLQ